MPELTIETPAPAENVKQDLQQVEEVVKEVSEEEDSIQPPEEGIKASDHPRYQQFFRMVKLGVPAQAVKNKMALVGEDPDVLDDPDAILPDD